jgi:hypothetical protein
VDGAAALAPNTIGPVAADAALEPNCGIALAPNCGTALAPNCGTAIAATDGGGGGGGGATIPN